MKFFILILASTVLWHTTFAQGNTNPTDSLQEKLQTLFDRHKAPGAVVVWVQNGETVILNTYGFANLEKKQPIDVEKTLFRLASISKPFTAIGILRQIEKEKLQLDQDINSYFDKPILNDEFETPVTLRHLLTHTAGFDDRYIGMASLSRKDASSLRTTMETMLPSRVMDAGVFSSYSNYGVGLAGYILEHVNQQSFAELMSSQVFKPLGMINSSFDPDEKALEQLVTGYYLEGQIQKPLGYDYIATAPASQMVSTAQDMATFMNTILQPAGLEDKGVLSKEMTAEMLSVQYNNHPAFHSGYGFTWFIGYNNGHQSISHDGGYMGTATNIILFPDHNAGLFIATNTQDGGFQYEASRLLISTFLPKPENSIPEPTVKYQDERPLSYFTGTWRNTRYTKSYFTKIFTFLNGGASELVVETENDTLLSLPNFHGRIRQLVQIGPLLFQSPEDGFLLAFREQEGELTHAFTDGVVAWERLHPLEASAVQQPFLGGGFVFLTVIVLIYLVGFIFRKLRKKQPALSPIARYEWSLAIIYIGGLLMTAWVIIQMPMKYSGLIYGVPKALYITNLMPYIALAVTLLLAYKIFNSGEVPSKRKAWSCMVVFLSVTYFFCLNYWNLTGWRF